MNKIIFQFLTLIFAVIPYTANSIEINDVGRRIPASIFSDWSEHYAVKNATTVIKYKAVNTIEGIKQVELGSADFGEADVPLTTAKVVFYCNADACWKDYKAAVAAINAGYGRVLWMRGGMPEWISDRLFVS